MKKLLFVLAAAALLMSCGGPKVDVAEVSVTKAWVPEGLTIQNPPEKMGFYQQGMYYAQDTQETMDVIFVTFEGKETRRVKIPRGQGPGEVSFGMSVQINNDQIYVYDMNLSKITIYDINGEYMDDILVNADIGSAGAITVSDTALYFHGMFAKKLVKVDLESGQPVKTIEYETPQDPRAGLQGEKMLRGNLSWDAATDSVYIGYYNEPYRIERYNSDMELMDTFTRKLSDKYEPMMFTQTGGAGNLLVASVKTDDIYLYAGFGGGQKITAAGGVPKIESYRNKYYISVFDKETGELVKEIRIKEIPEMYGVSNIVGVSDDFIAILIVDMGDTLKDVELTGKDDSPLLAQLNMKTGLVLIENPMK